MGLVINKIHLIGTGDIVFQSGIGDKQNPFDWDWRHSVGDKQYPFDWDWRHSVPMRDW
jgi:hypothetical protein